MSGRSLAAAAGYGWSSFSNFSNSSMANQITMSSYLGQQMSLTSNNSAAQQQAILQQAFGSNAMALNAKDAAMGQSTLNAISGFTAGNAPGYAQPLQKGAAAYNALLNYPNGASYAQSSALTALMMSPQTGMAFMQMGLGNISPLQVGGKVNTNASGMYEGLLNRFAPGQNLNQIRYNMRSGGVLSSELQQLFPGATQQQMSMVDTSMLDVAKLQSEGWSTSKINQTMQQAGTGNKTAQNALSKAGINLTDIQAQKNTQASQMSQQATIEQNFSKGLDEASQSLTNFNNAINAILKNPLINALVGVSSGFKGESSAQGSLLKAGMGSIGSIANTITGGVSGFFSHLFGGGAAAPSQTKSSKTAGSTSKNTNASSVPVQAAKAVSSAESQLGVPYQWGGEQPGVGFDCSGLIQWAYEQAGVALPRTSQMQWSYLKNRQVPLNQVQEGDIVFAAGSDGTASAPGHEALMVSQKQLIQAPYTGTNVQIDAFDSANWLFAARPSGSLKGSAAGGASTQATGSGSNSSNQGNAGAAPAPTIGLDPGNYGSVAELQAVQGALLGGIAVGSPGGIMGVSSSGGNTQSPSTSGTGGKGGSSASKGGTPAANQKIAQGLMKSYGWTSDAEWQALLALWNKESGWSQYADTRKTGLDPSNAKVFAYGVAQARPYSKYPKSGWPSDKGGQSNAGAQITWGLQYIRGTYGDPIAAGKHENAVHWYGTGTRSADKGWAVVGDRGPELMKLSGGESILNASQSAHIARQDAKAPMNHPYANLLDSSYSLPDHQGGSSSPAASAATGGGGAGISLTFQQGAIVLGQGVTEQDARSFADQVAKAMQQNTTIQAVATGVLHG